MDIFYPSLIDTYYPSRPKELDSTNLYDYAKWYDPSKKNLTKIKKYAMYIKNILLRMPLIKKFLKNNFLQ